MSQSEFNTLAKERYGEEIAVKVIQPTPEMLQKLNATISEQFSPHNGYGGPVRELTSDDFEALGERAWVKGNICPECGGEIFGLFGCTSWGLQHGILVCECGAQFRYYHYFKNPGGDDIRVDILELVGIPEEKKKKRPRK